MDGVRQWPAIESKHDTVLIVKIGFNFVSICDVLSFPFNKKSLIFVFPCVIFLLRPSPYSCPDSPSIVASVFASEPDSTCNFFLAQHKKLTKKSLIFAFPYLYPCSHMLCIYIFVKARGPIGIRDTMNSAKNISNHKGPSVRVGHLRLTMQ